MNELQNWRQVKIGDILIIKDEVSIRDALEKEHAVDGIRTEVINITTIHNDSTEWRIFEAKGIQTYFVLVKSIDEDFDLRVYQQNDWFQQGTRGDVLRNNHYFIFEEPVGNWIPKNLEYSASFGLTVNGEDITFSRKSPTIYGQSNRIPAALNEYSTDKNIDSPEILLYELGGVKNGEMQDIGGWITFLEGRNVRLDEVEILAI